GKILGLEEHPFHPFSSLDPQQTLITHFEPLIALHVLSANKIAWDCQRGLSSIRRVRLGPLEAIKHGRVEFYHVTHCGENRRKEDEL
ncbi:hypothetical protein Tco_0547300, partial [Tanacetum coccineum]